jgi:hypothetical protein
MSHPIQRATGFQIVGPYTLVVASADGVEQRIDFRPVLQGVLFGPLQDPATFNRWYSTRKPEHSYGRTALISIQQRSTTGPTWWRN